MLELSDSLLMISNMRITYKSICIRYDKYIDSLFDYTRFGMQMYLKWSDLFLFKEICSKIFCINEGILVNFVGCIIDLVYL